jgi:hypothetical protein
MALWRGVALRGHAGKKQTHDSGPEMWGGVDLSRRLSWGARSQEADADLGQAEGVP